MISLLTRLACKCSDLSDTQGNLPLRNFLYEEWNVASGRGVQKRVAIDLRNRIARGDLMPKDAMKDLLVQLGQPIPEVEVTDAPSEGTFMCQRTGRAGTQLPGAPFKGPVGQWIHENISAETWRDWIGQGTKVINELKLDLSRDEDSDMYDKYMHEYLGIDDEVMAKLSG